jgi:hypothetical protein
MIAIIYLPEGIAKSIAKYNASLYHTTSTLIKLPVSAPFKIKDGRTITW